MDENHQIKWMQEELISFNYGFHAFGDSCLPCRRKSGWQAYVRILRASVCSIGMTEMPDIRIK